jgi:hypothetical protein
MLLDPATANQFQELGWQLLRLVVMTRFVYLLFRYEWLASIVFDWKNGVFAARFEPTERK